MRALPVVIAFVFAGCRCGQPAESTTDAGVATVAEPTEPEAPFDASHAMARDAQPAIRGDDAGIDPACTGPDIDLAWVVVDPRCAINSARAKLLLDAGAVSFTQDAKLEKDGTVLVRLVNLGKMPVTLPISWHPKLPAFSALAEDEEHRALYELEPPKLRAGDPDAGSHIARIVMPPAGIAHARVTVEPNVMKRIAPSCDEGGCGPPRLASGKYVLHIGQLVVDVPAGAPARIPWSVP